VPNFTDKVNSYYSPRPAILIATSRSGSTFLLHCLDSHPQIGCERSEPLDHITGPWRHLGVEPIELMKALWNRPGYRVAMFKLSYKQSTKFIKLNVLQEMNVPIIHLHRRNPLRTLVSSVINTAAVAGELNHPTHSFEEVKPITVRLDPQTVIPECRKHFGKVRMMRKYLSKFGLPLLKLAYEDLPAHKDIDGNLTTFLAADIQIEICDFLEVKSSYPMFSLTRRINPKALPDIIENWEEVKAVLESSEFEMFLSG